PAHHQRRQHQDQGARFADGGGDGRCGMHSDHLRAARSEGRRRGGSRSQARSRRTWSAASNCGAEEDGVDAMFMRTLSSTSLALLLLAGVSAAQTKPAPRPAPKAAPASTPSTAAGPAKTAAAQAAEAKNAKDTAAKEAALKDSVSNDPAAKTIEPQGFN